MRQFVRDTGIVIKKQKVMRDNRIITLLTKNNGKINVTGFGVRKLLSRRISHLETGNYISFSYFKKNDWYILGETELIWGFSKIKRSESKLGFLFVLFFILNKILPENQPENIIFEQSLQVLTQLNNQAQFSLKDLSVYLNKLLVTTGFIDKRLSQKSSFDSISFIETLINHKITWAFAT